MEVTAVAALLSKPPLVSVSVVPAVSVIALVAVMRSELRASVVPVLVTVAAAMVALVAAHQRDHIAAGNGGSTEGVVDGGEVRARHGEGAAKDSIGQRGGSCYSRSPVGDGGQHDVGSGAVGDQVNAATVGSGRNKAEIR